MTPQPKIYPKGLYTFTGVLCALTSGVCLLTGFLEPIMFAGVPFFALGAWANFSNRSRFYGAGATQNAPAAEPEVEGAESVDVQTAVTSETPLKPATTSELISASKAIAACLQKMSEDRQVIQVLDAQEQLDSLRRLQVADGNIDSRLAYVAATDLIKCFEGLGYRPDMTTDTGQSIGIPLGYIILPDSSVWDNEYIFQMPQGQDVLNQAFHAFKDPIELTFDPEKFLLIELLRSQDVDEETVGRWAGLQYRYAEMMAGVDDRVTPQKKRWLDIVRRSTAPEQPEPEASPAPPPPPPDIKEND